MNQEDEEQGLKKLWSGFLKKMNALCFMHEIEEYIIRRVFESIKCCGHKGNRSI